MVYVRGDAGAHCIVTGLDLVVVEYRPGLDLPVRLLLPWMTPPVLGRQPTGATPHSNIHAQRSLTPLRTDPVFFSVPDKRFYEYTDYDNDFVVSHASRHIDISEFQWP
jgi:hypothetical protein